MRSCECGKEFGAETDEEAWAKVSGHILGKHVQKPRYGADHPNFDHEADHGSTTMYRRGCHCAPCRGARAAEMFRRRAGLGPDDEIPPPRSRPGKRRGT